MITTGWRTLDPGRVVDPNLKEYPRRSKRIRVEYGLDEGQFRMDVSVHEKMRGRWREISKGLLFEELPAHFPELTPYAVWDGFLVGKERDYDYLRDVWTDVGEGTRSMEDFQYRIRFGALPDDVMPGPGIPWPEVREWLEARHPRLEDAFREAMRTLGRISGPGFRTGPGFEGPKAWYPGMGDVKDWSRGGRNGRWKT